jgi:hypothetical protein
MPNVDVYERCRRWVQRNSNRPARPDVLVLFEQYARQALTALHQRQPRSDGKTHKMSIYLIAERVRWAVHVELIPDDWGFKVSNDYKPILARLLCRRIHGLVDHIFHRQLIGGEPTEAQLNRIDPLQNPAPFIPASPEPEPDSAEPDSAEPDPTPPPIVTIVRTPVIQRTPVYVLT